MINSIHSHPVQEPVAFDALAAIACTGVSIEDLGACFEQHPELTRGPGPDGYLTYNFEVKDYHNYVADCRKVHNDSAPSFVTPGEDVLLYQVENGEVVGYIAEVDNGFGLVSVERTATGEEGTSEVLKSYVYQGEDGRVQLVQRDKVVRNETTGEDEVIDTEILEINLDGMRYGEQIATSFTPFLAMAFLGNETNLFAKLAVTVPTATVAANVGEFLGGLLHHSLLEAGTNGSAIAQIAAESFGDIASDFANIGINTSITLFNALLVGEIISSIELDSPVAEALVEAFAQNGLDWAASTGLDAILEVAFPTFDYQPLGLVSNPIALAANAVLTTVLPQIESLEGQITSTAIKGVLTAVFAAVGAPFGPASPIVSFIVGYGVGKIIDALKSLGPDPQAWAQIDFDEVAREFFIEEAWSRGGGNVDIAKAMAEAFVSGVNWIVEATDASPESHAYDDHPRFGYVEGRGTYNDGRSGETFSTEAEAVFDATFSTLNDADFRDGKLAVARAIHLQNIEEAHQNAREGAHVKWAQDAIAEINATSPRSLEIVAPTDRGALRFEVDLSSYQTLEEAYEAMMAAFSRALYARDGARLAEEELEKYADLYFEPPTAGFSGSLHSVDSVEAFLEIVDLDWIKSPEEIYRDLTTAIQLAQDYSTYLDNTTAINAMIQMAPSSPFALGWFATLAKAEEMGLADAYQVAESSRAGLIATADGDDRVETGSGADEVRTYGGDDTVTTGSGTKTVKTGSGDDLLLAPRGRVNMDGGPGHDTVDLSARPGPVAVIGAGAETKRTLDGDVLKDVEEFHLTPYADVSVGDDANETVKGGGGNDLITTGGGVNHIKAGHGADLIVVDERGVNIIELGAGGDKLLVGSSGSQTRIIDFTSEDLLLLGFNFAGGGDLRVDALTNLISEDGEDAVLRLPGATEITFQNMAPAELVGLIEGGSVATADLRSYPDPIELPSGSAIGHNGALLPRVPVSFENDGGLLDVTGQVVLKTEETPTAPSAFETRRELSFIEDFNGVEDATAIDGNIATLTSANAPKTGGFLGIGAKVSPQKGAFNSHQRVDMRESFSVSLEFKAGDNSAGGDGLAFALHNDPKGIDAIGGDQSWIGVRGVKQGVALELDTFNHSGLDIPEDHTNYFDTDTRDRLTAPVSLGEIEDREWHRLEVRWDATTQTLSHSVDGREVGQLVADVSAEFLGGQPFAHILISAATGRSSQQHSVRNVVFDGAFEGDPRSPELQPDAFRILDAGPINGDLFAHNGSGPDSDPEGQQLVLVDVLGTPVAPDPSLVGVSSSGEEPTARQLESGAIVTFFSSGEFYYQPAVDFGTVTSGDDSFDYVAMTQSGRSAIMTATVTDEGLISAVPFFDLFRPGLFDGASPGVNAPNQDVTSENVSAPDRAPEEGSSDTQATSEEIPPFTKLPDAGSGPPALNPTKTPLEPVAPTQDESPLTQRHEETAEQSSVAAPNRILGTRNADRLSGTAESDKLIAKGGDDVVRGRGGDDTLKGGGGEDKVIGNRGDDNARGGANDDLLKGGGGADKLAGGGGKDALFGGGGDDVVIGGGGADTLDGGRGQDVLIGGGGSDIFVFSSVGEKTIADFQNDADLVSVDSASEFAELTITQEGEDVHVEFGDTLFVFLEMDRNDLDEDDFIF